MNNKSPLSQFQSKFFIALVWLTPIIAMSFLVAACSEISNRVFDEKVDEGIIEYQVTFPELGDESLTATLLPNKMTYAFKDDAFASYFEAAGGVFKNRIIANRKDKKVEHQLKVFRKKIKVMMNERDVMKMLTDYPKMAVINTEDTDTIAGFYCHKAMLVFEDVSMPKISVYYTKDINMEMPNWCTQYHEIDGVLMAYEIEEFGVRMKLEATSVTPGKVEDEMLNPTGDFQAISKDAMDVELAQLVETFEL
ncbi:MAG: hypothetical protein ABR574_13145 [Cryomorphaceae bacterium]